MDPGLVFRLVGRTLERTGGDQQAALRMVERATRWTGRARSPARSPAQAPPLTSATVRALRLAFRLHRDQVRTGTTVPYVAHLLGVAGIVMRTGGSEREVVAALLHDAVEDQGGARTMRRIQRGFGPEVARIVDQVTERPGSWLRRKQQAIHHIASGQTTTGALRVKLADCLHNTGTMTRNARREGDGFWTRFSGRKRGSLWYHRSMARAFQGVTIDQPLLRGLSDRLTRQVVRLHQVADPTAAR